MTTMQRPLAAWERELALSLVRKAIQNEVAGQRFYTDAAHHCIDPWAKEIFAVLAQDEDDHTRLLLVQHESLETDGLWLEHDAAMSSEARVDITSLTFLAVPSAEELFPSSRSASQEIDRRGDDLDALAFGIEMEEAAIDLYARAAMDMEDPAAKQACHYLVEEETRHLRQLRHRWESLAGKVFGDP